MRGSSSYHNEQDTQSQPLFCATTPHTSFHRGVSCLLPGLRYYRLRAYRSRILVLLVTFAAVAVESVIPRANTAVQSTFLLEGLLKDHWRWLAYWSSCTISRLSSGSSS
jgi:hypothetical protein